jgi:hypothetical protein
LYGPDRVLSTTERPGFVRAGRELGTTIHGGRAWLMTWQPILPPTVQQISGSGGIHLVYRVPQPYYLKTTGPASRNTR